MHRSLRFAWLAPALALAGCASGHKDERAAFAALEAEFIDFHLAAHPVLASQLGVHAHDAKLEDLSPAGIAALKVALHRFERRFDEFERDALEPGDALDLEFARGAIRSQLLDLESIQPYARDPDQYPGDAVQAAFYLVKRDFAPAEERLRSLIARERLMPAYLQLARANLAHPPRILTEIANEQIDGNRDFFAKDVPLAFAGVKDTALLAEFEASNAAVVAALGQYRTFLVDEVLPRSRADFAIGEAAYRAKLAADEGIETPLADLLAVAERDLRANQKAFAETAKLIDASRPATEVFDSLSRKHPAPEQLLAVTQASLDAIRAFIVGKNIVTIPDSPPATVAETPPFLRSTTAASMDTPGPFEEKAREAYYFMTLPDPAATDAEKEEFMRQWYDAMISNVSVHEAYPGHYIQFLYASRFPSRIRKVFGANTNIEGWAHYCEQMMLDEGFHAGEPEYRLAQLQDALLRDVRCIVGIRMHTQGMSVEDARKMFETEAYQPAPVAISEAKRGTNDPLYGYYTLGKLEILKLRAEYRAKYPDRTLRDFHDEFIQLGPLPLPLIRKAMLDG